MIFKIFISPLLPCCDGTLFDQPCSSAVIGPPTLQLCCDWTIFDQPCSPAVIGPSLTNPAALLWFNVFLGEIMSSLQRNALLSKYLPQYCLHLFEDALSLNTKTTISFHGKVSSLFKLVYITFFKQTVSTTLL